MCGGGHGVHNRPNALSNETQCLTRTQTSIKPFLHLDAYNTCWLNTLSDSARCSLVTPPICKGDKLKLSIKMWSMPQRLWLKWAPQHNEAIIQVYCTVNEWWTFERTQRGFPVYLLPVLYINLRILPNFHLVYLIFHNPLFSVSISDSGNQRVNEYIINLLIRSIIDLLTGGCDSGRRGIRPPTRMGWLFDPSFRQSTYHCVLGQDT